MGTVGVQIGTNGKHFLKGYLHVFMVLSYMITRPSFLLALLMRKLKKKRRREEFREEEVKHTREGN